MARLKNGKYSVTYASDVQHLQAVEELTSQIGYEVGFEESEVDDLAIAITELFNNAVLHGNKNDRAKAVILNFSFENSELTIAIHDEGEGFVPETVRNPLDPENIMADNGRGIYLVKMLMDSFTSHRSAEGSEIIISKKIIKQN